MILILAQFDGKMIDLGSKVRSKGGNRNAAGLILYNTIIGDLK